MKTGKLIWEVALISLLTLNGFQIHSQISGSVNMTPYAQQTDVWCWAASMEMIMKYHTQGPTGAQWQCILGKNYQNISGLIAVPINTDTNICTCSTCTEAICYADLAIKINPFHRRKYFERIFTQYKYNAKEVTTRMSWEDIQKEIDHCNPFIAIIYFLDALSGSGAHAVVVKGYKEILSETGVLEKFVQIYDPLRSCEGGIAPDFCDSHASTCEYLACNYCEYLMSYDLFNENVPNMSKKRVVGVVHNIYPISDTGPTSCDANRTVVIVPIRRSLAAKTSSSIVIIPDVKVPVIYLDSNKLMNPRLANGVFNSYISSIKSQEILVSEPFPQSKTQEVINGQLKTVFIRNLKELPKINIQIPAQQTEVLLKNRGNMDTSSRVRPFNYVYYMPFLYHFYQFTYNNKTYLAPTSTLKHPVTGESILKSGVAYSEEEVLKTLRQVTKEYGVKVAPKYNPKLFYTR